MLQQMALNVLFDLMITMNLHSLVQVALAMSDIVWTTLQL